MIVDDHTIVRKGLRSIIESVADWVVCAEAADGQQTLKIAEEQQPDVIVMDVMMPLLDGIEVTTHLHKKLPHAEFLILTMHESEEIIGQALRAGARGYLLKSESEEHLLTAIRALAAHRSYFSPSVSEALLHSYLDKGAAKPTLLTARERQIVKLVAEGLSNKRIARLLEVSVKTVESHRSAAMRKTGAKSSAELALFAVRNHLVQP